MGGEGRGGPERSGAGADSPGRRPEQPARSSGGPREGRDSGRARLAGLGSPARSYPAPVTPHLSPGPGRTPPEAKPGASPSPKPQTSSCLSRGGLAEAAPSRHSPAPMPRCGKSSGRGSSPPRAAPPGGGGGSATAAAAAPAGRSRPRGGAEAQCPGNRQTRSGEPLGFPLL